MKRYIKASPDYLINLSDNELENLYINVVNERRDVTKGSSRADYLDDLYYEVMSEIGARKHRS